MLRTKLGVAAVAVALAVGVNAGTAAAASSGNNQGNPPDKGNCFGSHVNGGSNGSNVSNDPNVTGVGPGLGQTIGKEERGCRG